MPVDLDGLILIDRMLDIVVELRLTPIVCGADDLEYLVAIHEQLLALNQLWQERELEDTHDLFAFRQRSSLAMNYCSLFLLDEASFSAELIQKITKISDTLQILDYRLYEIFDK